MIEDLLKDPRTLTLTTALLVAVWAFWTERVVPGSLHTRRCAELTKERDDFKDMLLKSLDITERTQQVRSAAFGKE